MKHVKRSLNLASKKTEVTNEKEQLFPKRKWKQIKLQRANTFAICHPASEAK
jgi:hypothetical protein